MDERFYAKKIEINGNAVDNYPPIFCLQLLRKLLTRIIYEYLNRFLEEEKILSEEQTNCKRNNRRTKDQLLLDKAVFRGCKRRRTTVEMAWIDCQKSYNRIPHSWISKCCAVF